MKNIKYNYLGFWRDANIEQLFAKYITDDYKLVLSNKPDYVFYSCFFDPVDLTKWPNAIRIFFSGENMSPDFIFFDYWIGFDFIDFPERFFRMPLALFPSNLTENDPDNYLQLSKKRYFCSFIYSHDDRNKRRLTLFNTISKYKTVSSFGKYLNNTGIFVDRSSKGDYERLSKFSLIIESTDCDGFVTEKIYDAIVNGTIPIYFGTKKVIEYFNEKRIINANSFNSIDSLMERIIQIDNDDSLFISVINESMYAKHYSRDEHIKQFRLFLERIFSSNNIVRETQYYPPVTANNIVIDATLANKYRANIFYKVSRFIRRIKHK